MRFVSLIPMLHTTDMARTRRWYETVLGFRCVGADGDRWCHLARDAVSLMFMRNDHLGEPQATATQYIRVDDAAALWEAIRGSCAAEWGPEDMPYGLTEFAIRDPDGYLLSFGSPTVTGEAAPR